jgi:hypothetical protein
MRFSNAGLTFDADDPWDALHYAPAAGMRGVRDRQYPPSG